MSVHAYMDFLIEREIVRLTLFNIQFPDTLNLHCILCAQACMHVYIHKEIHSKWRKNCSARRDQL